MNNKVDIKNKVSKSARIARLSTRSAHSQQQISAQRQARKILKALNEAEQIRSGKLKPGSFEEHFGAL